MLCILFLSGSVFNRCIEFKDIEHHNLDCFSVYLWKWSFTKLIVICKSWYYSFPCEASATLMALLWLTQARASPDGEKQTLCTQPPHSLYSRSTSPKGILDPHGVGPGLSSMSLIYAEKILWQQKRLMLQKQTNIVPSEYNIIAIIKPAVEISRASCQQHVVGMPV